MPIRNPFGRRAGAQDENMRAEPNGPRLAVEPPGFERVDTVGSKASSLSGKSSRTDTGAYKLSGTSRSAFYRASPAECPASRPQTSASSSAVVHVANFLIVVNDSGVYLPVRAIRPPGQLEQSRRLT